MPYPGPASMWPNGSMAGVRHPERLSALDSGFLVAETSCTPMHIGALVTIEKAPFTDAQGRVRLDEIRNYIADRLHLVPRMRQVVREVPLALGRPVWVDDPHFEIAHHVRLLELPAPGDDETLLAVAEEVSMTPLDRSRPLWEWWVIDGLDDAGVDGGRLAVFEKVHHCLVDGVGGVQIFATFTDLAKGHRPATQPWYPRPTPSGARLLASAAIENVTAPLSIAAHAIGLARSGPRGLARVGGAIDTVARMVRPSARAPSLSLNQPVGPRRRLATVTLDLAEMKAVAHDHHTKVNDVLLTVAAGGLRALLTGRGEPLVGQQIHAVVPEDVRIPGTDTGNHISGFFVSLPIDVDDPTAALHEITAAMNRERRAHASEHAGDLLTVADQAPYALVRSLGPVINAQPWVNTIVTNVPGPADVLTINGARVLTIAPLVPLSGNITVAVAALSYDGTITLMVNACRDACPDLDLMIRGMRETATTLIRGRVSRPRVAHPRRG